MEYVPLHLAVPQDPICRSALAHVCLKELGCFWSRQNDRDSLLQTWALGLARLVPMLGNFPRLGSLVGANQEELYIATSSGLQFSFYVSAGMFPSLENGS